MSQHPDQPSAPRPPSSRATPLPAPSPSDDALSAQHLRVVIVLPVTLSLEPDDDEVAEVERTRLLRIALLEAGYNLVATLPGDRFLPERLAQIQPDLIVVDAESQGRDILEHVVLATRDERRPIVMLSDDPDTRHVRQAIAAGVSAYVVAGTTAAQIRPVLEVAMARFEHEEQLRRDLADARNQLEERKVIDRAKGLLMTRQGLTEQEAYARLRRAAMDKGIKLADVAQRLIDAADLLG
ncbi:MAG: ANTAR domain-containing protein [Proteobacteria bacterium]|uniref:ANTAR domain-containing response regulator n=1 Tax=Aquabacterium sp. TaxID=1872578 RepID=UPI0035C7710A|nr:ANTAR domain-containing protein [Pseudomonadota bacterium]